MNSCRSYLAHDHGDKVGVRVPRRQALAEQVHQRLLGQLAGPRPAAGTGAERRGALAEDHLQELFLRGPPPLVVVAVNPCKEQLSNTGLQSPGASRVKCACHLLHI